VQNAQPYVVALVGCLAVAAFSACSAQSQTPVAQAQPRTVTQTVLYNFCSKSGCTDGEDIEAGLVQGADGNFYGTTYCGGTNDSGTIFKITPGGTLTTIYNFCTLENCDDGSNPQAALTQGSDGNFYGTTFYGGSSSNGGGAVFKVTPAGTLTVLHSFCSLTNCADGSLSSGAVVQGTDGNFYGTTVEGGANVNSDVCDTSGNMCGTLFKVTSSGTFATLYSFCALSNCSDGGVPSSGLVQGTDGDFYGTTFAGGGTNSAGSAFKFSTSTGKLTTIYDFCSQAGCDDGGLPNAVLVQSANGSFYGTTSFGGENAGGAASAGTIFDMTSSGAISILYNLCGLTNCTDGAEPYYAGVFEGSDGNFYGSTLQGGADTLGTVYSVSPSASFDQLYSFDGTTGESPFAGLVQGSDGNFYSTTETGGANSSGTVYKIAISPALAAPVQLTLSSASISKGSAVTLTWKVGNGFSDTLQQCYAFVQGGVTGAGTWTGKQTGTPSSGGYSGSASITPTATGTYTYALTCGGQESGFATVTVTSALPATTTTLVATPTSLNIGQSVTLNATVAKQVGSGTPTGSVKFVYGSDTLATVALKSGVATLTAPTTGYPAGGYAITAEYGGDSGDAASQGSTTVTLDKNSTSTVLTVMPNPVPANSSVTLKATVKRADSTGFATGTVTFYAGTTSLATASLNSAGVATLTASSTGVAAATYPVHAVYAGDAADNGSTSATVSVVVK